MSTLIYDQKALARQLEFLPNRLRVAFAAAAAERQVLNYVRFSKVTGQGAPELLAHALRRIWDDIEGALAADSELRKELEICVSLLPDDEQSEHYQLSYYAEDVVAAVALTLEARLGSEVKQAVDAAYRAYAALDEYVNDILEIQKFDQVQQQRILSHPLVQAEFRRQQVDLSELQQIAAGSIDEREGIADLRRRAQADAKVFFGLESD